MSFSSFFFLCLSVYLSVCLSVVQQRSFINDFSFVFLSFLSVCLSVCLSVKQRSFINEFSFVFLSFLYVYLSNKGHLLMSFPSFFFLFCLCQMSFINDFSFVLVCPVEGRGWGGGGVTPKLGQYGYVPPESPNFSACAAPKDPKDSTFFYLDRIERPPLSKIYICLFHFSDMD